MSNAVVILFLSFGLALLATPVCGWLGNRLGIADRPGGRRRHQRPVSRLGGLGFALSFLLTIAGLWLWSPPAMPLLRTQLSGVVLGTVYVLIYGLIDDKFELRAAPQFAWQLGATLIAVATTVWIQEVTLPFWGFQHFHPIIAIPLTIVWIMGMMNTINFLDGLDGLAAGVGGIAALLFAWHAYRLQQPHLALYALALAGACGGFLCFNFYPARVFLGSAGAMTLGYALATLSILAPARVATALLVLVIPIADTAFQVVDRWRRGRSPVQGDRGHLHFRLQDRGFSQRQIVVGYWFFCAVFGVLALTIPAPHYKLLALIALVSIVSGFLIMLSRRQSDNNQSD